MMVDKKKVLVNETGGFKGKTFSLEWLKTEWTLLIGWLRTRPAAFKAMSKKQKWLTGWITGFVVLVMVLSLGGARLISNAVVFYRLDEDVKAFLRDHKCVLPPSGSIHDTGHFGNLRWRVLYNNEKTPESQLALGTTWVDAVTNNSACVELEFLHVEDVIFEYPDERDAPENRTLGMIAECRVVRILARRDEETTNTLKEGDIITVSQCASTRFQYGATPPIQPGDRAIFFISPTTKLDRLYNFRYLSEYCEYNINQLSILVYIAATKSPLGSEDIPDFTTLYKKLDYLGIDFTGKNISDYAKLVQEKFDETEFIID
jgi:hypothetical protein